MGMAIKGSRRLVVDEEVYRWKVGRWRKVSDWRPAEMGLLDSSWQRYARRFGLGEVADVVFNVVIEGFEEPVSRLVVRVHSRVVDGFLGVEQLCRISPRTVVELVARGRDAGWRPDARGDVRLHVFEDPTAAAHPALLVLPGQGWPEPPDGYEPVVLPAEVWTRDV